MSDGSIKQKRNAMEIVDINTATREQLARLRGVGHVTAGRIISTRPYREPYDLVLRGVMGAATYEKIAATLIAAQRDSSASDS